MSATKHIWNFVTVGGVKRVSIERAEDLLHLHELDQKLWTALSCPVQGLEIDQRTLEMVDTDNDGNIRVPEVLAAVRKACSLLKNPANLFKQETALPLDAINIETPEGKQLYASAKVILSNLNKLETDTISAEETADTTRIFNGAVFNGDGVITTLVTTDESIKTLITHIQTCIGSVEDRSGLSGINQQQINQFFEACEQFNTWYDLAKKDEQGIFPLGDKTAEAYRWFTLLAPKIEDYFIREQLAVYDHQSTAQLNLQPEQLTQLSAKLLHANIADIAEFPLAKVNGFQQLPLQQGINPAWHHAMFQFKTLVVDELFPGAHQLNYAQWKQIEAWFEPHTNWLSQKAGAVVESLGLAYIQQILGDESKATLLGYIQQDLALADEAEHIRSVDELVRYYRDLFTLLKNFVTFTDFYTPGNKAVFQAGTLYIDQRSCDLCIKVTDMAKHDVMAGLSGMYLLYCECTSKSNQTTFTIAAALTNGDIDNLIPGRNGVFYDTDGKDWEARVVKIIENPISIRQAFWTPYRRVSRFIENQINHFAAEQDAKSSADTTKTLESIPITGGAAPAEKVEAKPAPFDVGKLVGIFAAIGLAIGAIGTALATVVSGFMKLTWWKMPLAVAGLLLLISGPSMIMAYMKLRKRNLAPLLDANGWAINAGAKINIQFGNLLTRLADLPAGARINLNDPFSQKQRPILPYVLFLSLLAGMVFYLLWKAGYILLR
jgi:hypothetical protein